MNTLFSDDNQNNELPTFDPDKDWWSELTGEGGKFHDNDPENIKKKIARAKAEADHTVKLRETELAELRKDFLALREEYNAVPRLQELIDQLANNQSHTSNETNHTVNDDEKPALTLNDVEGLFERRERERRETENLNLIQNKLIDRYGPNYNQHLKAQREQLGMSAEEVDTMAKTNVKAFERLFLSTQSTGGSFEAPPQGSLRSTDFSPRTQTRDWNYYENLRKTKPTVYWEPKTINQMHEDRKTLGSKFYG